MKHSWKLTLLAIVAGLVALPALAFDSSSSSFQVRHKLQSISGASSSTSFKQLFAGGQLADFISSSTSFYDLAGILKMLKGWRRQVHYHWRNDDGSEAAATSATSGVQDTSFSLTEGTPARLRVEVTDDGGMYISNNTQQFRLEYGLKSTTCAAIGSWTDVGAVGGDWDMSNSANLTDGNNTTNISVATGGVTDVGNTFLTPNGGVKDTSSQTSAVTLPHGNFIELEYSIVALSAATDGGTYCFRVTNAGSTASYVYGVYAEVVSAPAASITYSISANSLNLGTLTTTSVASANHTVTVTTTATSGYVLYVSEDGNLRSGANSITDVADGSVTAGSREYGLNTGNNDFSSDAAITSSNKIARQTGTSVTNEVTTCTYKASIDSTTPLGSYSHIVTYIVVGTF